MTIQGYALADGQLPSSEGTLYIVTSGTTAYIKSIICSNVAASGTNNVELLLRLDGSNSRRLIKVPLEYDEQLYFDQPLTLEGGDEIRGVATSASEVDYIISGGVS